MNIPERYLTDAHFPPTRFAKFVVDPEKCNACTRCVQTCPGQILEMRGEIPVDKYAADGGELGCIGCSNCYSVCPEEAIEIRGRYQVESGFYQTLHNRRSFPNPFGADQAPPFEQIEGDLTEVERVIYKRRSNRLFMRNKKVPDEILERVLEAGRFAPSGGNCQPWSFIVITDRDLLSRITTDCKKGLKFLPQIYMGSNGNMRTARKGAVNLLARLAPNFFDQRVIAGSNTVVETEGYDVFLHAPAAIFVLGDSRGIGEPELDCGLAAHNMILTAHSLGLGTCYVGFTKTLDMLPGWRKRLSIEWPYKIVTSIALGYPKTQTDKAVSRELPPVTWFPADRSGPVKKR